MKRIVATIILLMAMKFSNSQAITPDENTEICPVLDYTDINVGIATPNVVQFEITFPTNANDYTVNTTPPNVTDANKPVACRILQNIQPKAGSSTIGVLIAAFQDQRTTVPKFTV